MKLLNINSVVQTTLKGYDDALLSPEFINDALPLVIAFTQFYYLLSVVDRQLLLCIRQCQLICVILLYCHMTLKLFCVTSH